MGKYGDEVQQLFKGCPVDLHGRVAGIEGNAVLIVIDIGRILQKPILPRDFQRDNPMILPGRVVHPTGIALIFHTQQTLGIAGLGRVLRCRNGLGVLFRLG